MKTKIVSQRILTAVDGCVLTNGQTYARTVVLPKDADYTVWREIPQEEVPDEF